MATPDPTPPTPTAVIACQRCGAENSIQNVVRCSGCGNRAPDGTACHQTCVNCAGRIGCERECLHCGACETTSNSAHRAHCGSYHVLAEKCFDSCIKNVEPCVFGAACNHSNHPCCAAENCARGADSHRCCRGAECAVSRAVEAASNDDPFPADGPQHCCLGGACLLGSQRHSCCRGIHCESSRSNQNQLRMHPIMIPMGRHRPTPASSSTQTDKFYMISIGVLVVLMVVMGYVGSTLAAAISDAMSSNTTTYPSSPFFKPYTNYSMSEHLAEFYLKGAMEMPIPWKDGTVLLRNRTNFYTSPILEYINGTHNHDEIVYAGIIDPKSTYRFSPSGKALAVLEKTQGEFRYGGFYKLTVVTLDEQKRAVKATFKKNIRIFKWLSSINGKTGIENYVYVYRNDVYLNGERLTDSMSPLHYFGISDWVYEEEIFLSDTALFTSFNGNHFAYVEFDDSLVPVFEVPHYYNGQRRPNFTYFSYPKVGDTNPTVKLWISSVENRKAVEIKVPDEFANQDHYIFNVAMGPDYIVSVWANRNQDIVILKTNKLVDGYPDIHKPLRWTMEVNGFKHYAEPTWFKPTCISATGYYLLTPSPVGDNVFNGVTRIDLRRNATNPIVQSTAVLFDENLPIYCDEKTDEFYFVSNGGDQHQTNLFRKTIPGGPPQAILSEATDCKFVKGAQFVGDYLFANCQRGLYSPGIAIIQNRKTQEFVVKKVEGNFPEGVPLPIVEEHELFVNNITLKTTTIFPKNFTKDKTTKHPLLLSVYSGPNTNILTNAPPDLSFFAAYRGYIIVLINGRGTGGRGWKYSNPIMMGMGHHEIEDAIAGTNAIIESLKGNVDTDRTGVFGWSYGGFTSGHIAAKDQGKTFKCASLGAPVTDFRYYDSAYTERYLHLNETAYDQASLLDDKKLHAMGHAKLQLIHGLSDDNVHFQHHALLSEMLQNRGIHFRQDVYSNKDHGAIGFPHVRNEIDKFFTEECFGFHLDNY
uniref:TNFR-Cys domain-containing protein n=1 Tax=Panagrellus redivivus TaxID=6233 RepID=A0A7E4VJ85_PANRE